MLYGVKTETSNLINWLMAGENIFESLSQGTPSQHNISIKDL